jgi:hypothetical protein
METIAACGFETWAALPGRHSFTNTLNAVLKSWQHIPAFTAAMLHCEILNRLRHEKPEEYRSTKHFEFRKSPIHVISTNNPNARSVELAPRRVPDSGGQISNIDHLVRLSIRGAEGSKIAPPVTNVQVDTSPGQATRPQTTKCEAYSSNAMTSLLANGNTAVPHVLISLALEEEQLLDFDQCKRWLQDFPALANYATVQAVYRSNSTLLILSIPVAIWDWLPDNPACAFIGYVHSQNLLCEPSPLSKSHFQATKWSHIASEAEPITATAQLSRTSFLKRGSSIGPEFVAPSFGIDKQTCVSSDLRYMSDSDRSSMASSRRTWNTTSTMLSSWDLYPDDWKDNELKLKDPDLDSGNHNLTEPPVLIKLTHFIADLSSHAAFFDKEHDCSCHMGPKYSHCPQHTLLETKQAIQPEIPADASTAKPSGKYTCTSCQQNFVRKGDWKRHEESHDPQTYWTCMLGEPAILSSINASTTVWNCAFCLITREMRTDMVKHLMVEHKIHVCANKKVEDRTFYRKDKLKQHLQQVHALAESSSQWETWHKDPPKKWAWGCGFCGGCLFTWKGKSKMLLSFFKLSTLFDHFLACEAGTRLAQRLIIKHWGEFHHHCQPSYTSFQDLQQNHSVFSRVRDEIRKARLISSHVRFHATALELSDRL